MDKHFLVEVFEGMNFVEPKLTYNITATSQEAAISIALEWAEMEEIIEPSANAVEYFPDGETFPD
jgi:hypothetical protein